ncbi:MAG TPA: TetR/AcrR family transcriptional regulator [Gemmatimonadales bacterium]|nr:TetR/AcrR family transcriptional regulator [Gemmatimonadales bacterium]
MSAKSLASFERREAERVDTRNRILEAARRMFAEQGYEATTMRAIADAIRYTPTALYHHFPNKQALVTELCRNDFDGLASHFGDAARIADPLERIQAIGTLYLQFAVQYPNHYRFMFMTPLPDLEYHTENMGDPERDAYAMLVASCREAIERGMLRAQFTDADELAQILWAALHGLVSLRIVKHDPWVPWRDLQHSAQQAIDVLTSGIRKTAPAT